MEDPKIFIVTLFPYHAFCFFCVIKFLILSIIYLLTKFTHLIHLPNNRQKARCLHISYRRGLRSTDEKSSNIRFRKYLLHQLQLLIHLSLPRPPVHYVRRQGHPVSYPHSNYPWIVSLSRLAKVIVVWIPKIINKKLSL